MPENISMLYCRRRRLILRADFRFSCASTYFGFSDAALSYFQPARYAAISPRLSVCRLQRLRLHFSPHATFTPRFFERRDTAFASSTVMTPYATSLATRSQNITILPPPPVSPRLSMLLSLTLAEPPITPPCLFSLFAAAALTRFRQMAAQKAAERPRRRRRASSAFLCAAFASLFSSFCFAAGDAASV